MKTNNWTSYESQLRHSFKHLIGINNKYVKYEKEKWKRAIGDDFESLISLLKNNHRMEIKSFKYNNYIDCKCNYYNDLLLMKYDDISKTIINRLSIHTILTNNLDSISTYYERKNGKTNNLFVCTRMEDGIEKIVTSYFVDPSKEDMMYYKFINNEACHEYFNEYGHKKYNHFQIENDFSNERYTTNEYEVEYALKLVKNRKDRYYNFLIEYYKYESINSDKNTIYHKICQSFVSLLEHKNKKISNQILKWCQSALNEYYRNDYYSFIPDSVIIAKLLTGRDLLDLKTNDFEFNEYLISLSKKIKENK